MVPIASSDIKNNTNMCTHIWTQKKEGIGILGNDSPTHFLSFLAVNSLDSVHALLHVFMRPCEFSHMHLIHVWTRWHLFIVTQACSWTVFLMITKRMLNILLFFQILWLNVLLNAAMLVSIFKCRDRWHGGSLYITVSICWLFVVDKTSLH